MKNAVTTIKNVIVTANNKFEATLLNAERKVCGGKTIDESLAKIQDKTKSNVKSLFSRKPKGPQYDPQYLRILAEVETEMKLEREMAKEILAKRTASKPAPKPVVKPAVKQIVKQTIKPVVKDTQSCSCCKSEIPKEATFCPICRRQFKAVTQSIHPTPFRKCTDTFTRKPATTPQIVKAIPTTQVCSCGNEIPLEASFCPMCRKQLVIPKAVCKPAPMTACKIKGWAPAVKVVAQPMTLSQKIKTTLNTNVRLLVTPTVKCFRRA